MRVTRPGLAVAAALLLAECSDSKSLSVANVGTTTTATSSLTSTIAAAADQSQFQHDALKYSQCMRANGVPAFPETPDAHDVLVERDTRHAWVVTVSNAIRSRGHSLEAALLEAGAAAVSSARASQVTTAITVALSKRATNTSRTRTS
jgi:hypothetical protein